MYNNMIYKHNVNTTFTFSNTNVSYIENCVDYKLFRRTSFCIILTIADDYIDSILACSSSKSVNSIRFRTLMNLIMS